ncbi:MAG: type ISP restriction/modification enzyme [Pyrinomonadaceae bacterium]
MTFRRISEEYLHELYEFHKKAQSVGEMTAELSYRPILHQFFLKVCANFGEHIETVFEPRQQFNSGRPDWRFYHRDTLGLFGYVEAKGISDNREISVSANRTQMAKYLSLGYPVILTDSVEFAFFDPSDQSAEIFSLIDKSRSGPFYNRISNHIDQLELAFTTFFRDISARIVSEQQLVADCATRARYLTDEVELLADLPLGSGLNDRENGAIKALHQLRKLINEHHDPTLRDKETFARFVAQTLIFGLVYAHRVLGVEFMRPSERYKHLKAFWLQTAPDGFPTTLRPFRALTQILQDEIDSVGGLGIWYENCCLLLAHVQLIEDQVEEPDYHELFERFLEAFDPGTRFDYGAFYTPRSLAGYTVALVEEINGRVFDGNIYAEGNRLIDPCCGTGSFLDRLLHASVRSGGGASLIGFEILPAPYALANYRMARIASKYDRVNIVLTNTLSDSIEDNPPLGYQTNLFVDEQQAARDLAKPPFVLIIGNPPSSDSHSSRSAGPGFSIIQELLNDFRPPAVQRTSRQNVQKQLQNDFTKFLRWSGNKGLSSDKSIIALIVPSSFSEHYSYKFARKWFVDNYNDFWVLEIDKDARTGVRASNLFRTLQGRLLFVAVRNAQEVLACENRCFQYLAIDDFNLDEKSAFFEAATDAGEAMLEQFDTVELDVENPIFRPLKSFDGDFYSTLWPLFKTDGEQNHIFERHCSGIKLAPSSFFIHADSPILQRRTCDIADSNKSADQIVAQWFSKQRKTPSLAKFSSQVREAFARLVRDGIEDAVGLYSYRPFLNLPAVISGDVLSVLSKAKGGGTRYRPEILAAYSDQRTKGIALAPAPKDLGGSLRRFASFCWYLPDNDLSKRGNARVLCNYFPEYKSNKKDWDRSPQVNITSEFMSEIGTNSPEQALFYVYGVLCSNVYLDVFEPALFSTAGSEPPRIPVPLSAKVFHQISQLGEELACLEQHVSDEDLSIEPIYRSFVDDLSQGFKLHKFRIDSSSEAITLIGCNSDLTISPIPREILDFEIGGYQVLQQWLKIHQLPYTRTDFTKVHMKRLLHILYSIKSQIEIVNQLDKFVKPLVLPLK